MRFVFAAAVAALLATSAHAAPAAAPDPKDAQIAQLQAQLDEARADMLALRRQREICRDEEASALAQAIVAQQRQAAAKH